MARVMYSDKNWKPSGKKPSKVVNTKKSSGGSSSKKTTTPKIINTIFTQQNGVTIRTLIFEGEGLKLNIGGNIYSGGSSRTDVKTAKGQRILGINNPNLTNQQIQSEINKLNQSSENQYLKEKAQQQANYQSQVDNAVMQSFRLTPTQWASLTNAQKKEKRQRYWDIRNGKQVTFNQQAQQLRGRYAHSLKERITYPQSRQKGSLKSRL